MNGFGVGDDVRIKPPYFGQGRTGMVLETRESQPQQVQVSVNGLGRWWYQPHELERRDATEMDQPTPADAAVPAGVPGSADDEPGSAGEAVEHQAPEGSGPVAPVAMATHATLRERVERLERQAMLQDDINIGTNQVTDGLLDCTLAYTTTRHMRINVTKNTKGYSYDRTVEITTDDPDIELSELIAEELRLADNTARDEIEQCEYIDANGRPGADDLPTGNPF